MFIHLFVITIVTFTIIVSYFLFKIILSLQHKLVLNKNKVKYTLTESDHSLLNKYSKISDLKNLNSLTKPFIFYSDKKWSIENNNYILFNEDYYIIDKGYYYYINPFTTEIICNNEIVVKVFENFKKVII